MSPYATDRIDVPTCKDNIMINNDLKENNIASLEVLDFFHRILCSKQTFCTVLHPMHGDTFFLKKDFA